MNEYSSVIFLSYPPFSTAYNEVTKIFKHSYVNKKLNRSKILHFCIKKPIKDKP